MGSDYIMEKYQMKLQEEGRRQASVRYTSVKSNLLVFTQTRYIKKKSLKNDLHSIHIHVLTQ